MHIDYLVKMANDIGDFFTSDPDKEAAAANIHQHLKRFWDPRMKKAIIAHYNETKGVGLEGPVLVAVKQLAAEAGKKATPA
jgi:formate dehydrogenase subunit delta